MTAHWCQVLMAVQGLMFPIAASLFEAQQLNKRLNCSWKQMRSDDCSTARADWLNDFFFISSSSSTCCTASLSVQPTPHPRTPPPAPLFLSLSPFLLLPLQFLTPLTLSPSIHHFFCFTNSQSFTSPLTEQKCLWITDSKSPEFRGSDFKQSLDNIIYNSFILP